MPRERPGGRAPAPAPAAACGGAARGARPPLPAPLAAPRRAALRCEPRRLCARRRAAYANESTTPALRLAQSGRICKAGLGRSQRARRGGAVLRRRWRSRRAGSVPGRVGTPAAAATCWRSRRCWPGDVTEGPEEARGPGRAGPGNEGSARPRRPGTPLRAGLCRGKTRARCQTRARRHREEPCSERWQRRQPAPVPRAGPHRRVAAGLAPASSRSRTRWRGVPLPPGLQAFGPVARAEASASQTLLKTILLAKNRFLGTQITTDGIWLLQNPRIRTSLVPPARLCPLFLTAPNPHLSWWVEPSLSWCALLFSNQVCGWFVFCWALLTCSHRQNEPAARSAQLTHAPCSMQSLCLTADVTAALGGHQLGPLAVGSLPCNGL